MRPGNETDTCMSRYRKKRPTDLTTTLPTMLKDKGWQRKYDQHRVFLNWEKIVDKTTAAHARPVKVVKDVLWVAVENSSWMQQLQYQKIVLLESLNAYLDLSFFSDLRFTIEERQRPVEKKKKVRARLVPPPAELIEQFENQISCIEEKKVRDALMRYWYLSHACHFD
ncbi:MAG: hypothetical protein CR981_00625 [Proteobacteria bacterium]|nr:MAG: hypothetical protein CR981_00625 [Pseudomonadota bacterium]